MNHPCLTIGLISKISRCRGLRELPLLWSETYKSGKRIWYPIRLWLTIFDAAEKDRGHIWQVRDFKIKPFLRQNMSTEKPPWRTQTNVKFSYLSSVAVVLDEVSKPHASSGKADRSPIELQSWIPLIPHFKLYNHNSADEFSSYLFEGNWLPYTNQNSPTWGLLGKTWECTADFPYKKEGNWFTLNEVHHV